MGTGYLRPIRLPGTSSLSGWVAPLLLGGVFLGGALLGRSLWHVAGEDTARALLLLLSGGHSGTFSFFPTLGVVFLSNLGLLVVLFLLGFCAISQPVILLLPLIKGLGFGLVSAGNADTYSPYSAFFWLCFLPGAFLQASLVILAAKESLSLSGSVFVAVFGGRSQPGRVPVSGYLYKYLLLLLLAALFSLIDTLGELLYTVLSTV